MDDYHASLADSHACLNMFDRGGSLLKCYLQVCVRSLWLKQARLGDVRSSLVGHCGTMAGEGPDVLVSDGPGAPGLIFCRQVPAPGSENVRFAL